MKGTNIGEFEELVMLTIGMLQESAYGISIRNEIKTRTNRNPSIGALHSALNRLEDKGFISSYMEGPTKERRGRRKRFYKLTQAGVAVITAIYEQRTEMFRLIPNFKLD